MSVPLSSSYTPLKTDKQHVVYLERRACNDAANLAMGPGNDASASTDSVSQPGPKEVSTASQSAGSKGSTRSYSDRQRTASYLRSAGRKGSTSYGIRTRDLRLE